jgi:hypothetical protein
MVNAEGTAGGAESTGFVFFAMAPAQNERQARRMSAVLFMANLQIFGHLNSFMPVGRKPVENAPQKICSNEAD